MRTLPAAGISVESAALLMSGQQGGEIALGVVALPVRTDEGGTRVLLRLRLDGPSLLAGQTKDPLRVEAALYALDAGNGVQGSLLETVEIDLQALRSTVEQTGLDLLGSMPLKPGKYTLRMLARNLDTNRLAVRSVTLPMPEWAEIDPAPPLFPPPAQDPRVTVRSSTLGPLDPPLFPEDAALPATRAPAPALESLSAPAPSPLLATAEGRKLRAAASAAYRDALRQLAAGEAAEALAAVAGMEDSILQRRDTQVLLEDLVEIELEVAAELAKFDAESLVPLVRFHRRLHETAAPQGRRQGSSMAREVALGLIDLYRDNRGRAAVVRLIEASFADTLLRAGIRSRAEPLFQRLLAEDPGNELALLELAVDSDRRGARIQALGYVEDLLRAQPNHGEARLRRAVILERLGRNKEAIEGFRSVIQNETEGWRLRLAYQELARLLMPEAGAERSLREGLTRLPGDEKLTLLLAAYLERSGQRSQAWEVLAGFKPEGKNAGGAARNRYNGLPEELIESLRAELDREAAVHLATLAKALGRMGK
jgi:tetratricopeptide (TPR) repeat protein